MRYEQEPSTVTSYRRQGFISESTPCKSGEWNERSFIRRKAWFEPCLKFWWEPQDSCRLVPNFISRSSNWFAENQNVGCESLFISRWFMPRNSFCQQHCLRIQSFYNLHFTAFSHGSLRQIRILVQFVSCCKANKLKLSISHETNHEEIVFHA